MLSIVRDSKLYFSINFRSFLLFTSVQAIFPEYNHFILMASLIFSCSSVIPVNKILLFVSFCTVVRVELKSLLFVFIFSFLVIVVNSVVKFSLSIFTYLFPLFISRLFLLPYDFNQEFSVPAVFNVSVSKILLQFRGSF